MVDIIVVGSLNMDLSINVPRIPLPGETISGGSLVTRAGGKGANQAAACAQLGQDDYGRRMKANLLQIGVDVTLVKEEVSTPSGTAMILVDSKGENCIVLSAGANYQVSLEADSREQIKHAKLLLVQLEIEAEVVVEAIGIAYSSAVPVILNPAPAVQLPPEVYAQVTYLIPNETEATLLSGIPVNDPESAKGAAEILLTRGPQAVIITLGSEGCYLATDKIKRFFPAFSIQSVDTTGAGDAFIGGFASGLVEGKGLEAALQMALAAGALAATKLGAQTSLPNRQELDRFLAERSDIREVHG
jgi:ribokinase